MITISLLKELGFKKVHVTVEESGSDAYDFYELAIGGEYPLQLLTNELKKGRKIYVEFLDYQQIRFYDKSDLRKLVELLESNLIKK